MQVGLTFVEQSNGLPYSSDALLAVTLWVQNILTGSIGQFVMLVGVAAIGASLMTGRLPARRGITAVIGGFIIVGAHTIATGLMQKAEETSAAAPSLPSLGGALPPIPTAQTPPNFDPYARATVP